jgi:putative endonuclease
MSWYVYMLECSDASYYAGITQDPLARVSVHNAGRGARWTRMRRPTKLIYVELLPDKKTARQREIEIKGWRREKKESLLISNANILPSLCA